MPGARASGAPTKAFCIDGTHTDVSSGGYWQQRVFPGTQCVAATLSSSQNGEHPELLSYATSWSGAGMIVIL
jgi:hypothetical protein